MNPSQVSSHSPARQPVVLPAPIGSREIARTPPAELKALLLEIFSADPAFAGADQSLLDMIIPSEDFAATMTFIPGRGLLARPIGKWINRKLDLPADGRPWAIAYRSDKLTETGSSGTVDFASWQVVHDIAQRARRQEQVHLFSVLTLPDGTTKVALSRRRTSINDASELPGKADDRYWLIARRIDDYRTDPQFMRFLKESEALRGVLGGSPPPESIELIRTGMNRPFQQPLLKQLGARSHNFYVLNRTTRARMFIHFFFFWEPEKKTIWDSIGRIFTPHELGRYEVTDFQCIPRTPTWDPTLDTGLLGA
jgi:hypothetical protein